MIVEGDIKNNAKYRILLEKLSKNLDLKKAENVFSKYLGNFSLWLIECKKRFSSKNIPANKLCTFAKKNGKTRELCLNEVIKKALRRAKEKRKAELFECKAYKYGFCYPLMDNGKIFGYIVACQIQNKPQEELLELFSYFIETILKTICKEIEIENLYKTIKPRVLALSTVHTIHRLMGYTLDLNELLRRVARLTLQVIKANRCSIKLVDSRRKILLPKATVDLRTKKTKLKKVKIGKWAPGKAVKFGRIIRGHSYLACPLIDEDVIGVITVYDKLDQSPFNKFDEEIMETLAEQAAIAIRNVQLYREQEKLTMGSIKALAQIIESRGPGIYTPKASFLKLVQLIGQELKMREQDLRSLQYATMLHDAGELMVPENILKKRGRLTKSELEIIKQHPLKGEKIIKSLKSLKSVTPIIRYHHENYDGTGYPEGLKGSEIPLGARVLAVVGAFEAMIAKRPYRLSKSIEKSINEIRKNAGKQFDPKITDVFLKVIKRKDIQKLLKKETGLQR